MILDRYHELKAEHPDALLLCRMGDFYEFFHDDAKAGAKLLGLTLTSRGKGENAVPMTGFPYHQLEAYLAKLNREGHAVAVFVEGSVFVWPATGRAKQ